MYERTFFALGTLCNIKIFPVEKGTWPFRKRSKELHGVLENIEVGVHEFEGHFSRFQPDSEISEINRMSGIRPVSVTKETYRLIERSVRFGVLSQGGMDITIGPLSRLWSECIARETLPSAVELEKTKRWVGYEKIILDPENTSVYLPEAGMGIDLGAIAKGYCGDSIREQLKGYGVEKGIIDLGGNIVLLGNDPKGKPWRVGIQVPDSKRGESLGYIQAESVSIVTSGDYERAFRLEERNYHHIIDPRTGWPVQSNIRSITVMAEDSADSDGLATVAYMLGIEKAMEMAKKIGIAELLFVTEDHEVWMTAGLRGYFTLTNSAYRLCG